MASLHLLFTITVLTVIASVQGQADGDLRLVSSSGTVGGTSGRLEVYYSSQWGTVCDDGFGPTEALVACQQLGFSYSQSASRFNVPAASNGVRIWLDDLSCDGSENRLADCNHNPFGSVDCYHIEDIGLTCSGQITTPSPATNSLANSSPPITSGGPTKYESEGDLRLVGRDEHTYGEAGRVEVFLDSEWGTVCANNVRKVEADIVCQQLGFFESVYFGVVNDSWYGTVNSSVNVLLSGLVCNGDEDRLEQCQTNGSSSFNCSHSNDLAVVCQVVSIFAAASAASSIAIGMFVVLTVAITMITASLALCWYIAKRKRVSSHAATTPTAVTVPPTMYAAPQHHTRVEYPMQSNPTAFQFDLGQVNNIQYLNKATPLYKMPICYPLTSPALHHNKIEISDL